MATWDVFLPDVLVHVPDAPDPLSRQALRRASRLFCRRTRAWRVWCATTLGDPGQYAITLPTGSQVVRIEKAALGQQPLDLQAFHLPEYDPNTFTEESNIGAMSDDLDTLLVTGPELTGDVTVQLSLMPTRTATGVSDFVAERYLETIASGAAASLLGTRGADWYDPQASMMLRQEFSAGVAAACDDVTKWHTSKRPRAVINWC